LSLPLCATVLAVSGPSPAATLQPLLTQGTTRTVPGQQSVSQLAISCSNIGLLQICQCANSAC